MTKKMSSEANSIFLIAAGTLNNNDSTTIIINGFEDDPLCDEIRKLCAASSDLENTRMTHRPELHLGCKPTKTRKPPARLMWQGIIQWVIGIPKRLRNIIKPSNSKQKIRKSRLQVK